MDFGGFDDPGHDLDGFDGVLAHRGFAGKHDCIGAVENCVGAVGSLGARRTRVIDHGFQDLGCHDDRLGPTACQFNGAFLDDRHLFERQFNTEVATGNHDGIEGVDDFVELLHGLRLFDLGDHRHTAAFFIHDLVDALDVRGITHEREGNEVGAALEGPTEVVLVLFAQSGGDVDGNTGS